MTNPFAPTTNLPNERGVFADGATRRQASFVYRVIEFTSPFTGILVYNGWWFQQQVSINGQVCQSALQKGPLIGASKRTSERLYR